MSAQIPRKNVSVRMKTYNAPKHQACSIQTCAKIGEICSKHLKKTEQSRNKALSYNIWK